MGGGLSVLFFGTQMAIGGAQRLLLDQARWFHAHGHEVTAVFFYDKQGLQQTWQEGLGFPLLTLSEIDPGRNILRRAIELAVGLSRLWVLLRRGHFDVIETFTYDSNLLALPLAWMARVPVRMATHHGTIEGFPRWIEGLHSWIINAGIASILVCVSSKVLEQAVKAGTGRNQMIVIQNGIPLLESRSDRDQSVREGFGLLPDDVLLISVGRLVYQKGHEFLIRAMPHVLRQFPRVKVAICGEGTLRQKLEALIEDRHLQGTVCLLGNRSDVSRLLASADVFVLPSRWEGLPIALLEAMGSGLAVVATRVEGVEEVVQHESEGLLVVPEDSEALASALLRLIGQPVLRARMGAAASRRVRQSYTDDIMCEKYLQVMQDLLRRPHRTPAS
jgi:glycosyltransferase involved in cell wall biosynthesis